MWKVLFLSLGGGKVIFLTLIKKSAFRLVYNCSNNSPPPTPTDKKDLLELDSTNPSTAPDVNALDYVKVESKASCLQETRNKQQFIYCSSNFAIAKVVA